MTIKHEPPPSGPKPEPPPPPPPKKWPSQNIGGYQPVTKICPKGLKPPGSAISPGGLQLGTRVKDSISGFVGIAVGRTVYLHGCPQIAVDAQWLSAEGKTIRQWFDEARIESCPAASEARGFAETGTPMA